MPPITATRSEIFPGYDRPDWVPLNHPGLYEGAPVLCDGFPVYLDGGYCAVYSSSGLPQYLKLGDDWVPSNPESEDKIYLAEFALGYLIVTEDGITEAEPAPFEDDTTSYGGYGNYSDYDPNYDTDQNRFERLDEYAKPEEIYQPPKDLDTNGDSEPIDDAPRSCHTNSTAGKRPATDFESLLELARKRFGSDLTADQLRDAIRLALSGKS